MTMEQIAEALERLCEPVSISYIDLWRDGGSVSFCVTASDGLALYFILKVGMPSLLTVGMGSPSDGNLLTISQFALTVGGAREGKVMELIRQWIETEKPRRFESDRELELMTSVVEDLISRRNSSTSDDVLTELKPVTVHTS